MKRLKTMCHGILCKGLTVHTVAAMLALAGGQNHCHVLKDACMQFIFCPIRLEDVGKSRVRQTQDNLPFSVSEDTGEVK